MYPSHLTMMVLNFNLSEINKIKFINSPEAYIPQYGGFCAFAMSQGKLVIANPKSQVVKDGKLYFFTRMLFGIIDAKREWVKNSEEKNLANIALENMTE